MAALERPTKKKERDRLFLPTRNSVLYKFFALIALAILTLIGLFTWYISTIIGRNSRQEYTESNRQMLIRTVDQVDNSLFFLEQIVAVAGNNRYIVDAAVRPGLEYETRTQNVISFLREIPKNNQFITGAWLYESVAGTVYSSDGAVGSMESFLAEPEADGFSAAVARSENDDKSVIIRSEELTQTRIVLEGDRLYLVYNTLKAMDGKYISKLIMAVNLEQLITASLMEVNEQGATLHVSDRYGTFLDSREADCAHDRVITQVSSYTGWKYELCPKAYSGYGLWFYLPRVLPFLIVVLIGSLILAFVIAERIYAPISRLTTHVSERTGRLLNSQDDPNRGNELLFIHEAYTNVLEDKERAEIILKEIGPEIEKKVFLDLLQGHAPDEEKLQNHLEQINSRFLLTAPCQVLLLYFQEEKDAGDMVLYVNLREIEQELLAVFASEDVVISCINYDRLGILVIQYPIDGSAAAYKTICSRIRDQIELLMNKRQIRFMITEGRPRRALTDIGESFEEAKGRLRREIYYENENEVRDEAGTQEQEYYLKLVGELREHLDRNEISEAETVLDLIVRELKNNELAADTLRDVLQRIMDELIEKSAQYPNEETGLVTGEHQDNLRRMRELTDPSELTDCAREMIDAQFKYIKGQAQKRKNRIIVKVKEYVDEHYDNSDLSIQMVADSIDINASYLSNLFATYTGENLLTYINRYRIQIAIQLLQTTSISIKEIGFRTGFNSAQNFNRVFKRMTGTTPGKYRSEQGPEL